LSISFLHCTTIFYVDLPSPLIYLPVTTIEPKAAQRRERRRSLIGGVAGLGTMC
jgi:hypothetical protein